MNAFQFKQFSISQEHAALKLGTDAVLLGSLTQFGQPNSILDIGTGTGILALMMAQKYSCPITAIDIDGNAILDAHTNVMASNWSNRISVQQISLQDFTKDSPSQFDGIICNPPFFSNSLHNPNATKAIARHTITLTPMDLFHCVETLLSEKGMASIIIPYSEKTRFCEAATQSNLHLIAEWEIYPKTNAGSPNRSILQFSKQWQPFSRNTIAIRNQDSSYSEPFKQATEEFYFNLA